MFISIHALREEGDAGTSGAGVLGKISIHALREEGDSKPKRKTNEHRNSIHALREEGDRLLKIEAKSQKRFLSTPSARRATDPQRKMGQPWRI